MLYLPTVNAGALLLHSVTSRRPGGLLVPLLAGGCQSTVICISHPAAVQGHMTVLLCVLSRFALLVMQSCTG